MKGKVGATLNLMSNIQRYPRLGNPPLLSQVAVARLDLHHLPGV